MDAPFPQGMVEEIAEFLRYDAKRLCGLDTYSTVFESNLFFPLQRRRELARMMQIARSVEPKVVFEIGADKAGGLYHWCKSLVSVQSVIACEIRGTPYQTLFEKAFPYLKFLWLPQSSYDPQTVDQVRNWLNGQQIDCLFIDGDKHEFEKDFYSYLPLMNPKGIVFMHDINDSLPLQAFERVVDRGGYRHVRIIDTDESLVALQQPVKDSDTPHMRWLRHWRGQSAGVGVIWLSKE